MKEITLADFEAMGGIHQKNSLLPAHQRPLEKAWFNHMGVLGIVLLDRIDNDWSFVTLAKHPDRAWRFRFIDGGVSLPSFDHAKEALERSLRHHGSARQRQRDIRTPDPDPLL